MKKLYFWFIFLAVAGVILSFWLIPSKEQIARIEYKGKQMADAEAFYRKRFAEGDRSKEVILALVESEMEKGDIDAAIHFIEQYVASGAKDDTVLEYLSHLYRSNQDNKRYYATLLQRRDLKDTESTWRELATWYREKGDEEQYCVALQKLSDLGVADAFEYRDLAGCYIKNRDYSLASATLAYRRERFLNQVTLSDLLLELWVVKQRSVDGQIATKEIEPLTRYLQVEPSPQNILQTLQFFQKNDPAKLYYIVNQFQSVIDKNPGLQTKTLEILWEYPPNRTRVFDELETLFDEEKMNRSLYNLLIKAALFKKDTDLLHKAIREARPLQIDPSTVYEIVNYAWDEKDLGLIAELKQSFSQAYLQRYPVIPALLALGEKSPEASRTINTLLDTKKLTALELYYLLSLNSDSKDHALIERIGSKLPPFAGLSEDQLFDIAQIYIQIGKPQVLYDALQHIPAEKSSAALALLDLSLKRPERVQTWLQTKPVVSESILQGLFQQAIEIEAYPLTFLTAERLQKLYPSSLSDAYMALALVYKGDFEPGFVRLTELYYAYSSSETIDSFYLQALVFMAEKSKTHISELKRYIRNKLARGKLTAEKQLEFAYLYLDVIEDYGSAEQLFIRLIDHGQAGKQDIETLVYLIGPHPTPQQFCWLVAQTQRAPLADLGFWLGQLLYAGGFQEVVAIYEQACPDPQQDTAAFFTYMDALSFLDRQCQLSLVIRRSLSWITTEKLLDRLAPYVEYADDEVARRCIWERLVAFRPCDPLAWQQLGRAIYDQHDYCCAAKALLRFFELQKGSCKPNKNLYESVYFFAEILEGKRFFREATCCYLSALTLIQQACEKTVQMREIEANIHFKLGAENYAIYLMRDVYERGSHDPDLAAAVINMLLDAAVLKSARCFICGGASH